MNKPNLIEFPCKFPIKIMGLNSVKLLPEVIAIVLAKCPDFNPELDISVKNSAKGKYISITADVMVLSQTHLDSIYLALNAHELVKITL